MVSFQPKGNQHALSAWGRVCSEAAITTEEAPRYDSEAAEWARRLAKKDRQSAGLLLTTLEAWAEPRLRADLMQAASVNADRRLSSISGSDTFGGSRPRVTTTIFLCVALVLICVVPIAIMDDSRNPGRFVAPLGTPTLLAGIAGVVAVCLFTVAELRRPRRIFYHPALYIALALWNGWGLWFTYSRVTDSEDGSWSASVLVGSILTAAAVVGLVVLCVIAMRNPSIEDVVMRGGEIADEYDEKLRQRASDIIAGASGIDRVRMRASVVSGIRVLFDRGLITDEKALWMLHDLYG